MEIRTQRSGFRWFDIQTGGNYNFVPHHVLDAAKLMEGINTHGSSVMIDIILNRIYSPKYWKNYKDVN